MHVAHRYLHNLDPAEARPQQKFDVECEPLGDLVGE